MGNGIVCRYQRICEGEEITSQNSILQYTNSPKISHKSKPLSKSSKNISDTKNIANANKNNFRRIVTETKPSPKHISSNEAYSHFFDILNNIIKIQRAYRKYILRKKKASELSPSVTIHKCIPASITNDYPVNDEANLECIQLLSSPNVSIKKQININRSNISLFSRTLSSMSEAGIEGSIKGYFLKKNCKYIYKGGFLNKKKEGFGKVTWEDGSVLFAYFENSRAQGYCKFVDSNGSIFTGVYDNNKPCGYGVCALTNINVKYEGFWNKNNLIGIGLEAWDDDRYYQGEYENSKKKGIGLYRWSDGTIYRGEWNDNRMNGYGFIQYSDDRTYVGQVKNGEINGHGVFTWKDGGRYIGSYVNEQKQGFGAFIWNKKPITAYVGFWQDGKQNGVGLKITHLTGRYGIWKNGRLDSWLQGHWVIKQYLKPDQVQYEKFLGKSIPIILNSLNE